MGKYGALDGKSIKIPEIYDGALPSGNSAAAFNLIPINDKKELMDFFEL